MKPTVTRFRQNAAITVAAGVAVIGGIPLATSRWYFAPILLLPLAIAIWGWRAGTDANADGVRVRALFGSRFLPWTAVDGLVVGERNRVYAQTPGGREMRLTAVSRDDLPRLIRAGGTGLQADSDPH